MTGTVIGIPKPDIAPALLQRHRPGAPSEKILECEAIALRHGYHELRATSPARTG